MSDMADVLAKAISENRTVRIPAPEGEHGSSVGFRPAEDLADICAAALSAAGFGPVQEARAVPNAHDTTHVVKVVCNYCDHLGYQKVKLGQPIEHECSNSPVMDPIVSVTICAWEYETRTHNDDQ